MSTLTIFCQRGAIKPQVPCQLRRGPARPAMIAISKNIHISDNEIELTAIRASRPGGQHVNKVSSAIHLRFDIGASSLPDAIKQRLTGLTDRRISKNGVVVIKAQRFREREKNRADAVERLVQLIRRAISTAPKRVPTQPGANARRRRMDEKTRRGRLKSLRGKVRGRH